MKKVFKYQFELRDRFELTLPSGAEFLHADTQDNTYLQSIWALVDPSHEDAEYKFLLCGTGHEIKHEEGFSLSHISTWKDGPCIWHLFQLIEIPFQT